MLVSDHLKVSRKTNLGFTLIEILVVLALLGLIATMMPLALSDFYANKKYQSSVQSILAAARQCSIKAQQHQRSTLLGSAFCPLSESQIAIIDTGSMPSFNADGTASHNTKISLKSIDQSQQKKAIVINKLTANVVLANNE